MDSVFPSWSWIELLLPYIPVLFIARKLGYKVKQIPVTWVYVKSKRFNPIVNSVKMAIDVLKIRLNDIRGKYKAAHVTSISSEKK